MLMGMTLWIQTLDGRTLSEESDDHSLMYDLAEELDVACNALGQAALTSFFDTTDLEYNMSEDSEDEDSEEDSETGLAYGIDDMKWFDVSKGLASLAALRAHVAGGWKPDMDEGSRAMLIEELDDCIGKLKALSAQTGRFHLSVIM
jgi:hypothetical protein